MAQGRSEAVQDAQAQHVELWDQQYRAGTGLRRWPNEELIRFLGRRFGNIPPSARRNIHILEVGVGNGANAWAIAHDGFTVSGIDISKSALQMAYQRVLETKGRQFMGTFHRCSVTAMPFKDEAYDVVVDVMSMQHLDLSGHADAYREIARVLKPGGLFFSYHLGSNTTEMADRTAGDIDTWTLRNAEPPHAVYPNNGTVCMPPMVVLCELMGECGLAVTDTHVMTRTYTGGRLAEFLVVEGAALPQDVNPTESRQ